MLVLIEAEPVVLAISYKSKSFSSFIEVREKPAQQRQAVADRILLKELSLGSFSSHKLEAGLLLCCLRWSWPQKSQTFLYHFNLQVSLTICVGKGNAVEESYGC